MDGTTVTDASDLPQRRPHSLSPRALTLAGWIAFAIAGAIFLALAWNVASQAPLVTLDASVSTWLHRHHTPALTSAMFVITHAHSTIGMATASIVMALILARMREWYWIATLALAMIGGAVLNLAVKQAYERARPHFDDPLITLESFSFPSGHTAGATLFYGVLGAFLVSRCFDRRARATIVAGVILAVSLVAFSRMYLGAHYFSDVVAAAASSTVWLVLCLSGVHELIKRFRKARA